MHYSQFIVCLQVYQRRKFIHIGSYSTWKWLRKMELNKWSMYLFLFLNYFVIVFWFWLFLKCFGISWTLQSSVSRCFHAIVEWLSVTQFLCLTRILCYLMIPTFVSYFSLSIIVTKFQPRNRNFNLNISTKFFCKKTCFNQQI